MTDSPHDDPDFVRIFQYSEWLDSQGMIRPESEVGPQSHEQLCLDFLAEIEDQSGNRPWEKSPSTQGLTR